MKMSIQRQALVVLLLFMGAGVLNCMGAGNIDPAHKHAWGGNVGWANFAPTHGRVTVVDKSYLSGYAWSENIGWVKLGADGGGPYANSSTHDWGVNVAGDATLSGYAWSANAGWINFNPTHQQVKIDRNTGEFEGYAWGENIGWINFKSPLETSVPEYYNVRTTASMISGTVIVVR